MQSLTYKDIIDDKIVEWQQGLKKLEEQKKNITKYIENFNRVIAQKEYNNNRRRNIRGLFFT